MATEYKNSKNFLIIEMSYQEAKMKCNFGYDITPGHKVTLCDNCNNKITESERIYYFAALNRFVCKDCLEDLIDNLNRNPKDILYEKRHYNFYADSLKIRRK